MIRLHYSKRKVETKAEWLILALSAAIFENFLHRINPSLDSDETSMDAVIMLLFLFVLHIIHVLEKISQIMNIQKS